jgi:hypothetical protein
MLPLFSSPKLNGNGKNVCFGYWLGPTRALLRGPCCAAFGGQFRSALFDIIKRLVLGHEQTQALISSADGPAVIGELD